jgi:Fe-S cluster assembly protein SufB
MTHIGKDTRSRIISKGISAGKSKNSYRGAVNVTSKALGARNYSQCDSLLIGNLSNANTPFISVQNPLRRLSMKLRPRKWGRTNFLLLQRGICLEAVELMISGFCREILQNYL